MDVYDSAVAPEVRGVGFVKDQTFVDFILDQLGGLDDVRCRAMFGGHDEG
jgi:hypothetical protein